jgi:hypothetical protein
LKKKVEKNYANLRICHAEEIRTLDDIQAGCITGNPRCAEACSHNRSRPRTISHPSSPVDAAIAGADGSARLAETG